MSTITKSTAIPSVKSMMEDFWSPDRFFDKHIRERELLPAVNVRETKNHYQVELAVPGFKKNDFKIITENGFLTIAAESDEEKTEHKENYTRKEFSYSAFTRTFNLPDDVIEDNINASYHNGVLSLEIKKSGKQLTAKKQIKVD
ncbi:HSP20 family protein [Mucilaginibacter gracilis]|uniref:HSP20 family protein n=1 Tax=Mucilaginibacter gracilis TaxID=423350 RepID=A0A495J697_9SPHI|nr:Hsp20/alpha crystallin family protein [Mucilaginibacter gracilis]RKR84526.1 HSP20 family protein [Mucilaginibacter gracilis]